MNLIPNLFDSAGGCPLRGNCEARREEERYLAVFDPRATMQCKTAAGQPPAESKRFGIRAYKTENSQRGFSLLEVLVALALLSVSFVSLILVQARATMLAVDARNISIATGLARYQLMECKREAQKKIASIGDFALEGDFVSQGFPKFTWECHAPKFNMKTPSATATESRLKKGLGDKPGSKGSKGSSENVALQSDMVSPVMAMVTSTLGDSVRELAVIIRWKEGAIADEVRVVTHVIDLVAMNGLARMISQGAQAFGGSPSKEKDNKSPEDKSPDNKSPQKGPLEERD